MKRKHWIQAMSFTSNVLVTLGGPLGQAAPFLTGERFFVLNSDIICNYPFKRMLEFHLSHGREGTMAVTKVEEPSKYGAVVHNDQTGLVKRFVEKPSEYVANRVNAGLYIFEPSILRRIEAKPMSIETAVFPAMVRDSELYCIEFSGFWMDIGQPADYLTGMRLYLGHLYECKSPLLTVDPNLIGNVLVHETAKIGRGCRIGPNVTIGADVVIEDGVRISNSAIFSKSVIKSHSWLNNCIVGWRSVVGKWFSVHTMSTNITHQPSHITRNQRSMSNKTWSHGCTVWFTGLSGAGKTTLAFALERYLVNQGIPAYVLDGDNIRSGLNKNLGFSDEDRVENIRRVSEVAKLFADANNICLTSFISPFESDRTAARALHSQHNLPFFEVFLSTPIEVCEKRDVKGLYKRARAGEIKNFTGISATYENPTNPDLILNTEMYSVQECISKCIQMLAKAGLVPNYDEINPFGGPMPKELYVTDPLEVEKLKAECSSSLPHLNITELDLQWIQTLAEGWATPLKGFMREEEYLQVLYFGQLQVPNSSATTNFSIPIVLAVSNEDKERFNGNGSSIALMYNSNIIGMLQNCEIFPHRKEERCCRIFGTAHPDHPSIQMIMSSGDWLVGGDLKVFERIKWNDGLDQYRLMPRELHSELMKMKLKGQPRAVSIKSLRWNTELERKAQMLSDKCRVGHDTNADRKIPQFQYVGQNWAGAKDIKTGFQLWLDEYKNYDFYTKTCRMGQCGHYTQIVWEDTTDVGCGVTNCPNFPYGLSIVCNYGPGGNYIGRQLYRTA
ncbi:unnamed protein product [Schistosoma turkestanicum]|nr:unnamed protein product [Schistosoma turkestanicum]